MPFYFSVIRFEVLNRSFVLRDYDYVSGKSYVTKVLSNDLFKDNYRTRRSVQSDDTHDVMPLKINETPPSPAIPSLTHAPDVPPIPDALEPANDADTAEM